MLSWTLLIGAALRTGTKILDGFRPEKDERPAPLARGQLDRDTAAPSDLAHDVVQPVIVQHDVLHPPRGRAHLARAKIPSGAHPPERAHRLRQTIDIPAFREYFFVGKVLEQTIIHTQHDVPLRPEQGVDPSPALGANLTRERPLEQRAEVVLRVELGGKRGQPPT